MQKGNSDTMKALNYNTLREAGYKGYLLESAPVRVIQFGEGGFLRAFTDYFFDIANEQCGFNGKIAMVQPTPHGRTAPVLNAQEGLYTLYLRGRENGEAVDKRRVISVGDYCYNPYLADEWQALKKLAVSDELEYILSNTTEAGITYDETAVPDGDIAPASFPAKLTILLYERYLAGKKGLILLPCELIDNNGAELKKCVIKHASDWHLEKEFTAWVEQENYFCSTLVDRIVSGAVRDETEKQRLNEENGYIDELPDVGEVFGAWYIEGPAFLEDKLPFAGASLPIHVVPEVAPYKKRKVRILNGAHTGFVLGAYLASQDIVRDCMQNDAIHGFMNKILYDEVIPILPLDQSDCESFAAAVTDRFNNPFVDHQLLSISLNSTSKWKARNMPSFLDYVEKFGRLPAALTMSLAAYIAFYSCDIQRREENALVCRRPAGNEYRVQDDASVLDFYAARKNASDETLVHDVLANTAFWDQDLSQISGLQEAVLKDLTLIRSQGAEKAFASV